MSTQKERRRAPRRQRARYARRATMVAGTQMTLFCRYAMATAAILFVERAQEYGGREPSAMHAKEIKKGGSAPRLQPRANACFTRAANTHEKEWR